MNKIEALKDTLLFETQKEFYDERGKGARYRMTTAGVSYFRKEIKDWALDKVAAYLKENGFVKDVQIQEGDVSLTLKINRCALDHITEGFRKLGKPPLYCPIANVFAYALEVGGSKPPEILPPEDEGEMCSVKMAKIFTSDVVGG